MGSAPGLAEASQRGNCPSKEPKARERDGRGPGVAERSSGQVRALPRGSCRGNSTRQLAFERAQVRERDGRGPGSCRGNLTRQLPFEGAQGVRTRWTRPRELPRQLNEATGFRRSPRQPSRKTTDRAPSDGASRCGRPTGSDERRSSSDFTGRPRRTSKHRIPARRASARRASGATGFRRDGLQRDGQSWATITKPRSMSFVEAFGLMILKCCA